MEPTTEQAYQRRIAELEAEVAELKAQVARLSSQIAKLSKNSSNSSKPPSSDIVKPPKSTSWKEGDSRKRKRKIGGQPGHPKHERPAFSPEDIDRRITQGTRSERGQRWCERIWTANAIYAQQERSVFEYLREAVNAHFHGQPIPSLLPAGP